MKAIEFDVSDVVGFAYCYDVVLLEKSDGTIEEADSAVIRFVCAHLYKDTPLSCWQQEICDVFDIIPASHNSATSYGIDTKHSCELGLLAQGLASLEVTKNFTLCQEKCVYEQLTMGVRGLDLRVATCQDVFFVVHNFSVVPLRFVLLEVLAFLEMHPSEVVILNVKWGWEQRHQCNAELVGRLFELFRSLFNDVMAVTVERRRKVLTEKNQRIFVIFDDFMGQVKEYPEYIFRSAWMKKSHWANTANDEVLQKSVQSISSSELPLRECQFILTPTLRSVLAYKNLKHFTEPAKQVMRNNLEKCDANLIVLDFIEQEDVEFILTCKIGLSYSHKRPSFLP